MDKYKRQVNKIKRVEGKINEHLYTLTAIITLVTMALTVTEFFGRGAFLPADMGLFYLGVLLIYSVHKEMVRWLGKRKVERQGEYFVYGWIALTTVLYIVNFLSNGYFTYNGEYLSSLRNVSVLTVEVLAVFILTRCLKILKIILIK